MKVTWFDPGKMTGIAQVDLDDLATFAAWEAPESEAMDFLRSALHHGSAGEIVGFESIVITQRTAEKSQDVQASIRQIGVGQHLVRWTPGVEYVEQQPTDRKFCTNAKLHALGWWTKGPNDHPREATRHLVTWVCEHDESFKKDLAAKLR